MEHAFKVRKLLEVYETPDCATDILVKHGGVTHQSARQCLKALAEHGYFVGPREPTNTMLRAYLDAIRPAPVRIDSILQGIAKARKRWKAMAQEATELALSLNNSEGGEMVDTADLKSAAFVHVGSTPAPRTND